MTSFRKHKESEKPACATLQVTILNTAEEDNADSSSSLQTATGQEIELTLPVVDMSLQRMLLFICHSWLRAKITAQSTQKSLRDTEKFDNTVIR